MEPAFSRKPDKSNARAFFKVYEHPMGSGRRIYQSEDRSFRSGEGNDQESVAGAPDGNPYHELIQ